MKSYDKADEVIEKLTGILRKESSVYSTFFNKCFVTNFKSSGYLQRYDEPEDYGYCEDDIDQIYDSVLVEGKYLETNWFQIEAMSDELFFRAEMSYDAIKEEQYILINNRYLFKLWDGRVEKAYNPSDYVNYAGIPVRFKVANILDIYEACPRIKVMGGAIVNEEKDVANNKKLLREIYKKYMK